MSTDQRIGADESGVPGYAALAAGAMVLWVVAEIALRWELVAILADPIGSPRGADMLLVGIGFPLLAGAIAWLGRRRGIEPEDWDYEVSLRSVAAGVGGVVAFFVALLAVVLTITAIQGMPDAGTATPPVEPGAATWVLAALLIVNGLVVPLAEELAWRGVIQTALMDSYGVLAGSAVAATGFVLKHVVVDGGADPIRLASLVILAVIFSALRARWGTASSTVAHLGANLLATGLAVAAL
ncbi:CPBP family intramembrane glutamic endopeptidase [Halosimplex aquaticum]|uniref:CPBP family intramembrane glutamic endopeptidase n=1 Tax=Halosimplex aquaticum TaxID=3026162 RepID=A0ABD5Y4L0_9EURY|nr:CPBP family intramembrane glutamic endopeptidase [Halosimplex aquaticum]